MPLSLKASSAFDTKTTPGIDKITEKHPRTALLFHTNRKKLFSEWNGAFSIRSLLSLVLFCGAERDSSFNQLLIPTFGTFLYVSLLIHSYLCLQHATTNQNRSDTLCFFFFFHGLALVTPNKHMTEETEATFPVVFQPQYPIKVIHRKNSSAHECLWGVAGIREKLQVKSINVCRWSCFWFLFYIVPALLCEHPYSEYTAPQLQQASQPRCLL